MTRWLSRIVFIADIGRWHGRANYPGESDYIELPLYAREQPEPIAGAQPSNELWPTDFRAEEPAHSREEQEA